MEVESAREGARGFSKSLLDAVAVSVRVSITEELGTGAAVVIGTKRGSRGQRHADAAVASGSGVVDGVGDGLSLGGVVVGQDGEGVLDGAGHVGGEGVVDLDVDDEVIADGEDGVVGAQLEGLETGGGGGGLFAMVVSMELRLARLDG